MVHSGFLYYFVLAFFYLVLVLRKLEYFCPLKIKRFIFLLFFIPSLGIYCYLASILILPLQGLLFFAFLVAILYFFYQGSLLKKIYLALSICFLTLISQGIFNSLYSLYNQVHFAQMFSSFESARYIRASGIFISIILTIIVFRFVNKKNVSAALNNINSLKTMTIPLLILVIGMNLATIVYYISEDFKVLPFYHLLTFFCISLIYGFIFIYCVNIKQIENKAFKNDILENQLSLQMEHYQKNAIYVNALKKIKHDYLDYLRSIEYLSKNYDRDQLLDYVQSKSEEISSLDLEYSQFSNNPLIDAILLDAKNTCNDKSIAFKALVSFPIDSTLRENEVCFVFTTTVNHTILVADCSNSERKYVNISSNIKGGWISIIISCNYNSLSLENVELTSIQKNEHRFTEEIIEQHHGFIEIIKDKENDLYQIQLMLPNQTTEK